MTEQILVYIIDNNQKKILATFQTLTIATRVDVSDYTQVAYVLENGVLEDGTQKESLWEQYKEGFLKRSRRFYITFDIEGGRCELIRCILDVPSFLETNDTNNIKIIRKAEGLAEEQILIDETIEEFKTKITST